MYYTPQPHPVTAKPAPSRGRTKKIAGIDRKSSESCESSINGSMASAVLSEDVPNENLRVLTTVMMRNLPNKYSRDMLLELLDSQGFNGCYDLVYLPIDFRTGIGFGYAFINLITAQDATRFRVHFQGFAAWDAVAGSSKICEVSWSDAVQGLHAHIERYRNSPVMHESD